MAKENLDLHLEAETIEALEARASARGLTLNDYLESLLAGLLRETDKAGAAGRGAFAMAGFNFAEFVRRQRAVTVSEAKTHLSRYVERAEAGEPIAIARGGGAPAAVLIPVPQTRRVPGGLLGIMSAEDAERLAALVAEPMGESELGAARGDGKVLFGERASEAAQ